jgi:hypothetical protein
MHRRIVTILEQIRQDLASMLSREMIVSVCRALGHTWRECKLDPVAIVHVFITQILHGNTALAHVPRLVSLSLTAQAYCQARARLPLAVFQVLLRKVVSAIIPMTENAGLWRGHRTFLLDGSSFSMSDVPALREHFGQPTGQLPGCGFPVHCCQDL